jgi:hypothetical protein
MTKDSSGSRRFAVALSFPGEHRPFVEQVAGHLAAAFGRDRVLYDKYYEAEFARLDLDVYLPGLYREQSELVVLFLYPEYAEKRWCNLEWRHIRQLIATVDASRIMLLRYGYSGEFEELGILSGDGSINFEKRSSEDIAEKIGERLHINNSNSPPKSSPGPNEAASIAATQPPLPLPPPFPMAEAKDGPARFRTAGTPLGRQWDPLPLVRQDVSLAGGAAVWLRVMPSVDPGTRWQANELKKCAIQNGRLKLVPFSDYNPFFIRANDGMAMCSRSEIGSNETRSFAFIFETGEVWSVDTDILAWSKNTIRFLESQYAERLQDYANVLLCLGVQPPFHWIAGMTGVENRCLAIPPAPGKMRIPGWPGPECLAETITKEGEYDGQQTPVSALKPFFNEIFARCGVPRPDHLSP